MRRKVWVAMRGIAIVLLLGLSCTASAKPETAPRATLAAFANETDLNAYVESLVAERARTYSAGYIVGTATPGSPVVVENTALGFRREMKAEKNGRYSFWGLKIGTYRVTADNASREVKIELDGGINAIDVSSVESTTILTAEQIAAVPVARNITNVALLAPGTVRTGSGSRSGSPASDLITNVQSEGVDEGGIVKKAGDFLIVLRRGRLFSLRATEAELAVVSRVDAAPPGTEPGTAWYDELLISGRTIALIGYSYARRGTEVSLFHLAENGGLSYRATYQLSSGDYYSSRNFAARLIGNTLYFYAPKGFSPRRAYQQDLPGWRRWQGKKDSPFERLVPADRIYRSGIDENNTYQILHTVTRCELSDAAMDCRSSAVLGPRSQTFYVSNTAAYVWVANWPGKDRPREAAVLRMPLDGSAPSMLGVQGSPIDQLSFLEQDGFLNVLVGTDARGQGMWGAEYKVGDLALLRLPLSEFGASRTLVGQGHYRRLPGLKGDAADWSLTNRYVGDWLLYGSDASAKGGYAVRYASAEAPVSLKPRHRFGRIEAMGDAALIVGQARRDLVLSSVDLRGDPHIVSQFTEKAAIERDSRTHGFFYNGISEDDGLFGLPVSNMKETKARIVFLRNRGLQLQDAGELAGKRSADEPRDGCTSSCYDWYGDSRPIFIGDRVYALLGYELIEGRLVGDSVRERRRLDYTPSMPTK